MKKSQNRFDKTARSERQIQPRALFMHWISTFWSDINRLSSIGSMEVRLENGGRSSVLGVMLQCWEKVIIKL